MSVKGKGNQFLKMLKVFQLHKFTGPHPAGNVGVQIEKKLTQLMLVKEFGLLPTRCCHYWRIILTGKLNLQELLL